MSILASLRTPAEVVAITLEDVGGIPIDKAKELSEDAMRRVAKCLEKLKGVNEEGKQYEAVLRLSPDGQSLQWATVTWDNKED